MRRTNFAPTRRVGQEANWERALSVFMVVNGHGINVTPVERPLAPDEELW